MSTLSKRLSVLEAAAGQDRREKRVEEMTDQELLAVILGTHPSDPKLRRIADMSADQRRALAELDDNAFGAELRRIADASFSGSLGATS